jgi:glucose/arabinose dehydrogenase
MTLSPGRFLSAVIAFAVVASAGPTAQDNQAQNDAGFNRSPFFLPEQPQDIQTLAGTRVRVTPIKGLRYPWSLAFLPNGDMLVTEAGRNALRLIRNGVLDPKPVTGLPTVLDRVTGPSGGVDVAVHPRFAENGLIYYTYWKVKPGTEEAAQNQRTVRTATLGRARYEGGYVLEDARDVFVSNAWTDGPAATRILFGPDGKVYMVIGSPGATECCGRGMDAQDPSQHGGKVLRLNEDGSVPSDNPFVGQPGHAPEVYALGIRNSIGLIAHPETGEIWETEHGPYNGDEVNIIKRGANYGWPITTFGRSYIRPLKDSLPPASVQPPMTAPGMEPPVAIYTPVIGIGGMTFYTGDQFPLWRGSLLVGGMAGRQISRIAFNRQGVEARREPMLTELRQRIRDVRQGPDGLVYATTDEEDGAVLKIAPAPDVAR